MYINNFNVVKDLERVGLASEVFNIKLFKI